LVTFPNPPLAKGKQTVKDNAFTWINQEQIYGVEFEEISTITGN
jgi:hypothetical protein